MGIVVVYLGARLTINLVDQACAEQVADRAYAQVLPEVEEWSADVRRALEPTLGAPVGWRREVGCGVTAQIGGWFPQDCSHACTLRHTLVFPVADEREAWAALALLPDDVRVLLLGKPDTDHPTPDCAPLLELSPVSDPARRGYRVSAEFQDPRGEGCRSLQPLSEGSVDTHFALRTQGTLKDVSRSLGPVLIVTREHRFGHWRLGCGAFSTLFCDVPPFAKARLPEPPE